MKNTKGFTLIEGLLILVIVGLLGGTGWYVWNARSKTNGTYNAANQANSAVTTHKSASKSSTAVIISTNDKKVQLTLPSDWVVQKKYDPPTCDVGGANGSEGTCLLNVEYKPTSFQVPAGPWGLWQTMVFSTNIDSKTWAYDRGYACPNTPSTDPINGYQSYNCVNTTFNTDMYVISNGKYLAYSIVSTNQNGADSYKDTFKKIVESIKFSN